MELLKLIGLTVVAIKSNNKPKAQCRYCSYILFSDGATYLSFEDQDGYTYHDYDNGAKNLNVEVDKVFYQHLETLPDANVGFA